MKKTITSCDVCGSEIEVAEFLMQVIFTTNQTDGIGCVPYFTMQKMDLCEKCLQEIIKTGKYIFASGAQGYNKYFFKEK
jgi:hypothetical protein